MAVEDTDQPALSEARRSQIAELLQSTGAVTVAEVQTRFGISPMTARRDLTILADRGVARRTHGGAVRPSIAAGENSFAHRLREHSEAKTRLAEAAYGLLVPGQTVFLDASSTTYYLARLITQRRLALRVITNSLPVLHELSGSEASDIEVIAIGGTFRRLTCSYVGPAAVRAVRDHFADAVFLSVTGVAPSGVMTDVDGLEAEVKRAMLEQAEERVLLLDGSKVSTRGRQAIASLDAVTLVLADGECAERHRGAGSEGEESPVTARWITTAAVAAVFLVPAPAFAAPATGLEVNATAEPLGLDDATPRFSWRLSGAERGLAQDVLPGGGGDDGREGRRGAGRRVGLGDGRVRRPVRRVRRAGARLAHPLLLERPRRLGVGRADLVRDRLPARGGLEGRLDRRAGPDHAPAHLRRGRSRRRVLPRARTTLSVAAAAGDDQRQGQRRQRVHQRSRRHARRRAGDGRRRRHADDPHDARRRGRGRRDEHPRRRHHVAARGRPDHGRRGRERRGRDDRRASCRSNFGASTVNLAGATTKAHANGAAVYFAGSGITLGAPLTGAHAVGAALAGTNAPTEFCRPPGTGFGPMFEGACREIRPEPLLRKAFTRRDRPRRRREGAPVLGRPRLQQHHARTARARPTACSTRASPATRARSSTRPTTSRR